MGELQSQHTHSYRLYEVMSAGSIPAIIGSASVDGLPFAEVLPWDRVAVLQRDATEEGLLHLVRRLRELTSEERATMAAAGACMYQRHLATLEAHVDTLGILLEQRATLRAEAEAAGAAAPAPAGAASEEVAVEHDASIDLFTTPLAQCAQDDAQCLRRVTVEWLRKRGPRSVAERKELYKQAQLVSTTPPASQLFPLLTPTTGPTTPFAGTVKAGLGGNGRVV